MKHEIDIKQPEYLIEDWPRKYDVFSWIEYVVTVPNPMYIVTTCKSNGMPNANLQSWGLLIGEKDNYSSLLALHNHCHTYANILREKEWCVGFPAHKYYPQCFETININAPDNDEITEAGFTIEKAKKVQAPRIAECSITLECQLVWYRPLYDNSNMTLFAGRVVHLAMDEEVMVPYPEERIKKLNLMYNVRSTVNPLTGEQYGPNTLGLLNKVERIFTDDGQPKGWSKINPSE
jgi:flavin reductase (DIM6/NTAB) family NADH-FMN oxidoreductase RutF